MCVRNVTGRDIVAGVIGGFIVSVVWTAVVWFFTPLFDIRSPLDPEKLLRIQIDMSFPACRTGDLSRHFEVAIGNNLLETPNGADHTLICDTYVIRAKTKELWAKLAQIYPSCFTYNSLLKDKLYIITNSGAVCRTPFEREGGKLIRRVSSSNIYLCIGSAGREDFRPNVLDQPKLPQDCTDEELKQFQFLAVSRKKPSSKEQPPE